METSTLSSQLKRMGLILRSGAEGQIKDYNRRFHSIRGIYDTLLKNLIIQDLDYAAAFKIASQFFKEGKVRFAAVDGTEYTRPLYDLVIFFGGAYAMKGDVLFHRNQEPTLEYDPKMLQSGYGISSCIPLYVNEVADVDQTILGLDDRDHLEMIRPLTEEKIIKNATIAEQIMSFSELYLAYRLASDPHDAIHILFLDRSLSTMHINLIYDTSHRKYWNACALNGYEVEGETINSNDLSYGIHRIVNETLMVPPFRGEYLRYSIIFYLEKGSLTRKQLFHNLDVTHKDQQDRIEKCVDRSLKEGYLLEENGILSVNPRYSKTWTMLKKAVNEIGEQLYSNTDDKNPMKVRHKGREVWLTTLDFQFLTLFSLSMLIEACWQKNILLLGVTKDTSAQDFKNHVLPLFLKEEIWSFNSIHQDLSNIPNTDRMFLQSVSLNNYSQIKVPWSLVEYDSAFTSILPENDAHKQGYVSGAIQNMVGLERTFLKSYVQLSQAKSDPQMRSNVLLVDRIVYPEYDLREETTYQFHHLYGGGVEDVGTIVYKDKTVANPLQNLVLSILYAMSKSSIPEVFGHNVPLFMADKIAKYHFTEFRRIIDSTGYWILNNPDLRKFIFYMSTFRERRSEIESNRRSTS